MSDGKTASPKGRLARSLALKAGLSALLLLILLAIVPLAEFTRCLRSVSLGLWSTVLGLFVLGHVVAAVKWSLLMVPPARPRFPSVLRCHFAGLFANLFLPSAAGGDAVRLGLALRANDRKAVVVLGSVIDRLLDTLALGLWMCLGGLAAHRHQSLAQAGLVIAALALLLLGGMAASAALLRFGPQAWRVRAARPLSALRDAASELKRRPQAALAALSLSLTVQGAFVLLNAQLGRACGIDLPLAAWYFAWPLAKLAAMVPISLAGIGVREAALAGALAPFGVAFERAVAVGLLWETIVVAGAVIGGAASLGLRRTLREPASP